MIVIWETGGYENVTHFVEIDDGGLLLIDGHVPEALRAERARRIRAVEAVAKKDGGELVGTAERIDWREGNAPMAFRDGDSHTRSILIDHYVNELHREPCLLRRMFWERSGLQAYDHRKHADLAAAATRRAAMECTCWHSWGAE